MDRTLKFICFSGLILAGFSPSNAQARLIPEKYLKIIPGITTRDEFEKIYGKGDPKSFIEFYQSKDFVVTVMYSSGGCEEGKEVSWAMPKGAIEEVS
jgi:hypothetical protein